MDDLIIIGGGPAGLAAAVYAIRRGLKVHLISPDLGGKTNDHMELADGEVYYVIRGTELVRKLQQELQYRPVTCSREEVTAVLRRDNTFTIQTKNGAEWQAKTVIYATGARVRKLAVPGEETFTGRGVTYSAISYAPLFLDRSATVVGNGRLAVRATAELANVAAAVHLVSPNHDHQTAPLIQKLGKASNIVIWDSYQIKHIDGNGYVQCVTLESPTGRQEVIQTDGVFVELGLIPNSELVKGLVNRDQEGYIEVDSVNRTSCPGLFAAGDVTTAYAEQVLIAVGEGIKAALSAADYLLLQDV
jgi:thioredoxin reductase